MGNIIRTATDGFGGVSVYAQPDDVHLGWISGGDSPEFTPNGMAIKPEWMEALNAELQAAVIDVRAAKMRELRAAKESTR